MDYTKTLKLHFRVRDLNRQKAEEVYPGTTSREKKEGHAHMYPCGKTKESRTYIAGWCEMYKEERDVLEQEMRK